MGTTLLSNTEALPLWARQLAESYYSRTIATFVLYGNVRDYVPLRSRDPGSISAGSSSGDRHPVGTARGYAAEYLTLPRFLNQALFGQRDLVVTYDR